MSPTRQKVFISYSHKDKDWVRGWLLPRLENSGVSVHIDFRDFEIGAASVVNMERAVEKCAKTLLVLTHSWVDGEFTQFEGIMLQTEDPIGLKKKILPVKLDDCQLPRRLQILTYADFRYKNEWHFQIDRIIKQIKKDFAKVEEPSVEIPILADENVDITRLPKTGHELFGRQKELRILNEAWESADLNVLSFVAYGGVGKSTLVNKWLEKMRWDNYRGAQKVFGWSFYSQGTKELVTSADKFILEALAWFGDSDPANGSPWDKGHRLADLIRKKKTLLILDGVEPLQSAVDFERGKIKDPALSMLVTQLSRKNNGLCVITTRVKVAELARFDTGVKQLNLDQISKEAGRDLLRMGGVQGKDAELEEASKEFGNHALAINLLAGFLHEIEGHHVKNASNILDLDIPEEEGKHPRRVIEAFEKHFSEGPESQLLRILGFFDRPVEFEAIKAVYSGSPIVGLTDKLMDLTEAQWQNLFEKLRRHKLLARKSTHRPDVVDCHPLLREHFGKKLQESNLKGWSEVHGRLFKYYKNLPEKQYPDTLEEMEPLFMAVSHGCQAGQYQEALYKVYWERIKRKDEHYSTAKLGAYGSDLAALAGFFDDLWSKTISGLSNMEKAAVLCYAGFRLRALGHLSEATQPLQAAFEETVRQEDWRNAYIDAANLSGLYLMLGKVQRAVDYAQQGMDFARRSGDAFQIMDSRTFLAEALHQAGQMSEAESLLLEADDMQKQRDAENPYLYSGQGFLLCDLLLSKGQYGEVLKRATQTIQVALRNNWLVDIGLDKLSLGRAHLIQAQKENTGNWRRAAGFLNQAVDDLRHAGIEEQLPSGLLARAELYRYQRSWAKAWEDLEEAAEIAELGQLELVLANYHLEAARLCLAQSKMPEARRHCEEAAKRVQDIGYHRRAPEVMLIQTELELAKSKKGLARQRLKEARERIREIGCHRLDIELERLQALFLK